GRHRRGRPAGLSGHNAGPGDRVSRLGGRVHGSGRRPLAAGRRAGHRRIEGVNAAPAHDLGPGAAAPRGERHWSRWASGSDRQPAAPGHDRGLGHGPEPFWNRLWQADGCGDEPTGPGLPAARLHLSNLPADSPIAVPLLLQGLPAPYTLAATTTAANLISIFDSSSSFGVTNLLMIAIVGLVTAV